MTADMRHELRTPLTVMAGYIEALRDGVLKPTPARFDALNLEAQQLKRLVEDLRTLSLADAGELPLTRQATKPYALLERVATAFSHRAGQENITLRITADDSLPEIRVDPERLVQVGESGQQCPPAHGGRRGNQALLTRRMRPCGWRCR